MGLPEYKFMMKIISQPKRKKTALHLQQQFEIQHCNPAPPRSDDNRCDRL